MTTHHPTDRGLIRLRSSRDIQIDKQEIWKGNQTTKSFYPCRYAAWYATKNSLLSRAFMMSHDENLKKSYCRQKPEHILTDCANNSPCP